jgi:hypothetical protein
LPPSTEVCITLYTGPLDDNVLLKRWILSTLKNTSGTRGFFRNLLNSGIFLEDLTRPSVTCALYGLSSLSKPISLAPGIYGSGHFFVLIPVKPDPRPDNSRVEDIRKSPHSFQAAFKRLNPDETLSSTRRYLWRIHRLFPEELECQMHIMWFDPCHIASDRFNSLCATDIKSFISSGTSNAAKILIRPSFDNPSRKIDSDNAASVLRHVWLRTIINLTVWALPLK